MSGRFQIALHILTLLQHADGVQLSSDYIAGSVNVNPVLIRKEISNLKALGLIESREGKNGGYTLAKDATQINLADVYKAVSEAPLLGRAKNQPNPKCTVGKHINQHLDNLSANLNENMIKQLSNVSLAAFTKQFN